MTLQAQLDTGDCSLKMCIGKPYKCEKIETLQCSAVDAVAY